MFPHLQKHILQTLSSIILIVLFIMSCNPDVDGLEMSMSSRCDDSSLTSAFPGIIFLPPVFFSAHRYSVPECLVASPLGSGVKRAQRKFLQLEFSPILWRDQMGLAALLEKQTELFLGEIQ